MNRRRKPNPQAKRILIVDDDLGFVLWLGLALDQAGYAAFPARNSDEALNLVEHMDSDVDLLVVNPMAPFAATLVHRLRDGQRQMKVVALFDEDLYQPVALPYAEGSIRKPRQVDRDTSVRMVHLIDRLLVHHRAA